MAYVHHRQLICRSSYLCCTYPTVTHTIERRMSKRNEMKNENFHGRLTFDLLNQKSTSTIMHSEQVNLGEARSEYFCAITPT